MSNLTYRGIVELGVATVVIAIGLFFTILASQINPAAFDPIGPRFLPLFLSIAIIALGMLIGVLGYRDRTNDESLAENYGFKNSNLSRMIYVIGAGFIYVVLFSLIGYFAATLISFILILAAFGVRNAALMIGLSVITATLYQYVFMGLMGLNDPAGTLIDFRSFTNLILGA